MRKKIPNGLYKKLAAYSVFVAFCFGFVISAFQIYRDYTQQDTRLVDEINQRVSSVQGSAEKAVYEFDEALAQLVLDSIAEHQAVMNLSIFDDYNDAFKAKKVRGLTERPNWWPSSLALKPRTLSYPLNVNSELENQVARIEVEVDPFLVINDLFGRSVLIIISGVIRNILLALALLFISYKLITKAILGLRADLAKIDPLDDRGQLIIIPEKHKNNELGSLANLINDLLVKIRQGMRQISNLNTELNQQLLDKSQIEKALNLAGERTAGRTGKEYINSMVEFIGDTLQLDGVSLYRRNTQGSEVEYQPVISILHGKQVQQKTLQMEDLHLDLLSGHHSASSVEINSAYTGDVFQTLYGMTIPIRNSRRNIVNLLQLVSVSPISEDFYYQHKSLLQILSSRFVTESERERQERMILEVAHTDSLTKLSNRNHFQHLLKQCIVDANELQEKVILLHVDVNNFKRINDLFGYEVGDQLLIQIAQRLKGLVSESCHVARVGGDEFVIIIRTKESGPETVLSQNIHTASQKSFVIDNHLINAKVSVGLVMYPDHAKNSEELIKHADYAVNLAKHKDGIRTQNFTQEVAAQIERKVLVARLLSNAIEYSLLSLKFQPIYCLSSGKIESVEVLCRWNNPELGVVSPEEFIPVAEETGLIHNLGTWVLKQTIKTVKLLSEQLPGDKSIKVAVNFSAHQLNNPALVEQYLNEIRQSDVNPNLFTFEITESMLIDNLELGSEILNNISDLGCDISIDDFGTGYSSLQYLKHLPIKNLKIDKGFINGIPDDDSDMNIVEAIVSLAKSMGMSVIAEGVEHKDQVDILEGLGCDLMQGYYFAKPLSYDELVVLINDQDQLKSVK